MEEQDTRCLTCWTILDGSSTDGHQLNCRHWLCWPCLGFLKKTGEDGQISMCFRCQAPVFISDKCKEPKAAGKGRGLFSLRDFLSSKSHNSTRVKEEEASPVLPKLVRVREQKNDGAVWKKIMQRTNQSSGAGGQSKRYTYSKFQNTEDVSSSLLQAKQHQPPSMTSQNESDLRKRRCRLSLNLF